MSPSSGAARDANALSVINKQRHERYHREKVLPIVGVVAGVKHANHGRGTGIFTDIHTAMYTDRQGTRDISG